MESKGKPSFLPSSIFKYSCVTLRGQMDEGLPVQGLLCRDIVDDTVPPEPDSLDSVVHLPPCAVPPLESAPMLNSPKS